MSAVTGQPYTVTIGPGASADIALLACECWIKNEDGTLVYDKAAGSAATVSTVVPTLTYNKSNLYDLTFTPDTPTTGSGDWLYFLDDGAGLNAYERVTVRADEATPEADPRLTVAEAKIRLNIESTDTSMDAYLARAIPDLIEYADEYCNRGGDWLEDDATLPGGVKQFVCQAARFLEDDPSESIRLGPASVSRTTDDLPKAIKGLLSPWKLARFV